MTTENFIGHKKNLELHSKTVLQYSTKQLKEMEKNHKKPNKMAPYSSSSLQVSWDPKLVLKDVFEAIIFTVAAKLKVQTLSERDALA